MLSHKLYYLLKPVLPWRLRIAVRRFFAERKRVALQAVWPIDPTTAQKPQGWPGWPDQKQFAFILTHDVEGPEGVAKCRQLAELEMKLGFRSSFNFIPEGSYRVSDDLRAWLTDNGFEVGVHDLNHDGKLFSSRSGFALKATKINHYLHEWQACGYRSGFMLRNLDWMHDLNVCYDASTFDTDPFEPQSDGAGTIFPYWIPAFASVSFAGRRPGQIPGPLPSGNGTENRGQSPQGSTPSSFASVSQSENRGQTPGLQICRGDQPRRRSQDSSWAPRREQQEGRQTDPVNSAEFNREQTTVPPGYVELPYTLPQDSTLFFVLQEKTPDIWLRKLDWVAAHGGMALVNVHPDYINHRALPNSNKEYSVSAYAELLRHVAQKYSGQYWHPLPRDLAVWYKGNCRLNSRASTPPFHKTAAIDDPAKGKPSLRGKRAAVLLYSVYPADPRPRRAAEAMIEAGMEVDLLCLGETETDLPEEVVAGVKVFRIPLKRDRGSKWIYFWKYGRFLASSFWFLLRNSLKARYDVVHVHNMPDVLVFAALIPKFTGARVILDLHDPMPELMMTIYGLKAKSFPVRILRFLERWSIGFSNLALTPNITFKNLFVARSCRPEKMQIVMNSPRQDIFDPDRFTAERIETGDAGEFRVMHHGSIVHRHGVDLLVEAVARLRPRIPGIRLDIYGTETPFLGTVLETAKRLGVADIVRYHGAKNQHEIADAIRECHVGVVPNRRSVFTDINFPTRIFEYLAMHRPVIAPDTQGINDYFQADQMLRFEPNNVADLAAKILWVREQPKAAEAIVVHGTRVYRENLWSGEKARFLGHVARLVNKG